MATTAMDYENANGDRFEDDGPRYERDQRSASPRPMRDEGNESARRRSASPIHGSSERPPMKDDHGGRDQDDGAVNPGSNLFVTGIHPRLNETEVTRMFEKYGEVEKCQIMRDPHTKESRGFGFVKMVTSDQADAAKEGLQGEQIEGRTLSIEKARRARPRTPTPGKYFGPPKREARPRFNDRFEDRRRGPYGGYRGGGGGGGGGGGEDPYRYRGYERRGDDRGYDRGYRDDRGYDRGYREDRGYERRDRDDAPGRVDRYAGGRDDRYGPRDGPRGAPDERRGPRYERDGYDRAERDGPRSRDAPPAGGSYGDSAPRPDGREAYGDRNVR